MFTKLGEVLAAQEKVRNWFFVEIARAKWIYGILKILFKFMFPKET